MLFMNQRESSDLNVILDDLVLIESRIDDLSRSKPNQRTNILDLVKGLTNLALHIECEAQRRSKLYPDHRFKTLAKSIGDRGRDMVCILSPEFGK